MSEAAIAFVLGISVNTLKKHCLLELTIGRQAKRAQIIDDLFEASAGGSVAAAKHLQQMQAAAAAQESINAESEPTAEGDEDEAHDQPKALKLGKKEVATAAAETAGVGTEWGNDLLPSDRLN